MQEMAQAAAEKGLQLLGITEHAPGIPGTCAPIYFKNLRCVPRQMYGVELMLGVELNILNYQGDIDMEEELLSRLDLRIAGIHSLCYTPGTTDENTAAMIGAIRNPWVDIISHPGDGTASLHFEPIVLAAKEHHTLLEINNSSLSPEGYRGDTRFTDLVILNLSVHFNYPVLFASDSHGKAHVGDFTYAAEAARLARIPRNLILNHSSKALLAFLAEK